MTGRSRTRRRVAWALLAVATTAAPPGVTAQKRAADGSASAPETTAYLDATAGRLHRAARAAWERIDDDVVRYTAVVRERLAASLRTPLKDRTIYRSESARRVFWDRDGETLVQVLARRAQNPTGVERPDFDPGDLDGVFDPTGDRLFFGFGDEERDYGEPGGDDFWFEHPLAPEATDNYRFQTGDTLTLSFPDGRSLRAVELQVVPRTADVHRMTGSLWIEPESGALVRAVYRLSETFDVLRDVPDVREEDERGEFKWVPGIFKPWTFELSMVAVEYALWDFEIWLPRSMRLEGVAAAGVAKAPLSIDLSYDVESVVTEADVEEEAAGELPFGVTEERRFASRAEAMAFVAEVVSREEGVAFVPLETTSSRGQRTTRYVVPEDVEWLHESPHLPPPVWEDAPGFMSEEEADELFDDLASLPEAPARTAWAANWGLERPDLVRYNRVEGLAVGGRFQVRAGSPVGPVSLTAEPFLALGDFSHADDLDLTARLSAETESLRRKVALGAYREVRPVTRRGRHLGIGNSASALLFGRDDGDYFRATGADLVVTPPSASRESWRVRLYGERHHALDVSTEFSFAHAFDDGWDFRPNVDAARRWDYGGELLLSPWWGTDPLAPQAGIELYAQGAGGDSGYGRASLTLRGSVPFRIAGYAFRAGAEAAGGRGWGDVPAQRQWFLGGPSTLRGYEAATLVGDAFARGRFEVARVLPVASVALFTDAGWTGPDPRSFAGDDALLSVGIGASVLDGLIHLDVARGLREPRQTRWDFYLDAAF